MGTPGRKPGSFAQALRVLKLLEELRGRRYGATYADLAERFEVTERQIRRDLDILDDAGHTLDRRIGADGRVKVRLEAAHVRSVVLTQRERFGLLAVRRVFDVLEGTPFEEDVTSIYEKLLNSFTEDEARELEGYGERFVYVPEGGTKSYRDKVDVLDALLTGTLRRWRVRYRYLAGEGERRGVLEPYAMLLYKQGLYVIGAAEHDGAARQPRARTPHVHAVERFEEAEFLRGETFEVPRSFRADHFFDSTFGIYMGDTTHHVVIDFQPSVKKAVQARRWHRTQKLSPRPGGGVRLEFDCTSLTQVHSWVLSWGPGAQVREPPALVEQIRDELRGLVGIYGTGRGRSR